MMDDLKEARERLEARVFAEEKAARGVQGPSFRDTEWGADIIAAHSQHAADLRLVLTSYDQALSRVGVLETAAVEAREFMGEVGGTCLGVAMSTDHPAPDEALMRLFRKSQDINDNLRAALQPPAVEGERKP